jgi:hypothetical protein
MIKFKDYLNEKDFRWTKDVKDVYINDFENCPGRYELESTAMGVIVGSPLPSQEKIKEIYPCFEKTREVMKKKFGSKITFYRVEINTDHPSNERFKKIEKKIKVKLVSDSKFDLKIWKRFYKHDLEKGIRHIVAITVPVDDVLAVYRRSDMGYREIHILTKNAKYEVIG